MNSISVALGMDTGLLIRETIAVLFLVASLFFFLASAIGINPLAGLLQQTACFRQQ